MERILITGGSGFLGRGILRRMEREGDPSCVTIYSRDEYKQDLCRHRYPTARYVLGDVRDIDRLASAMQGHDIVIHAGALKYIPEGELNALECIAVNVDGSRNVVHAAGKAGVERVVGISTDKAVMPVNVYGASKMLMERMFAEANGWYPGTRYNTARYGNVVGSTGSVIPLFQKQLAEDGYVKVTDPKMTRFWMGIDEAINTIWYALNEARLPGSVIVPRPKAMSIGNLAVSIAGEAITIIGSRPGEKEHEELIHYQESVRVLSQGQWYEVLPVGQKGLLGQEPFTVSSHSPPNGWLTAEEMLTLIEDAREV